MNTKTAAIGIGILTAGVVVGQVVHISTGAKASEAAHVSAKANGVLEQEPSAHIDAIILAAICPSFGSECSPDRVAKITLTRRGKGWAWAAVSTRPVLVSPATGQEAEFKTLTKREQARKIRMMQREKRRAGP